MLSYPRLANTPNHLYTLIIAISFLLISTLPTQICLAEVLDVFLLAGQSNMVGSGRADLLPQPVQLEYSEVLYTHNTDFGSEVWGPLRPRLTSNGAIRRWIGPEFSFGRRLVETGYDNPAIIKYARNGTSLAGSWGPEDPLRANFFTFVDQALASLAGLGHTYQLSGFIWVQGSGDAGVLENAQEYDTNLSQFIGEIEGRYGQTTTILNRYHIDSNRSFVPNLRVSQTELGDLSSDVYLVHTDDLTLNSDNIHFTTNTHLSVGERLADRFLHSLGPTGDVNEDGIVDAADYSLWRDHVGSISQLEADADGDGIVESDDYDLWVFNYGQQTSSLSVPEPTSALMGILLACVSVVYSRPLRTS